MTRTEKSVAETAVNDVNLVQECFCCLGQNNDSIDDMPRTSKSFETPMNF